MSLQKQSIRLNPVRFHILDAGVLKVNLKAAGCAGDNWLQTL